ncbi:class II aldolase/adducin family protein [Desmospora profundinema]|uniref:Ribulose-5-phosphate 4-epimerase/fuculose-1-phosphate aldolase n=1 Tax=Desmospora profundinema TaxID=1571184 RepID=A0ABU1IRJ5_9BACL|nr:class II aldolase/adducin family protein [Desmospora profundinema]MDR6227167.1 ribulose-5-phosphate 4-epimerase/fuculose-1-phosphate aldolase [Desmospora profundinema]
MNETFAIVYQLEPTPSLKRFAEGIQHVMESNGYRLGDERDPHIQLVFNMVDPRHPRHFRRKGKGTFVITVAENHQPVDDTFRSAYPVLIQSLGNMMIFLDRYTNPEKTFFITLEQGCYPLASHEGDSTYYQDVFKRIRPLASSQLVIDNTFHPDLPEDLREGDTVTNELIQSGKKLDGMNLLPTPFPIEELLPDKAYRHVQRLYGIGGLSYGNLSARREESQFWMSARGVNKAQLQQIGRDILLIKGYDPDNLSMEISVPADIEPKRASVDAIEHWMIYTEHPEVGAIVHIHAWMEGIPSTEINYPCGTVQLAEAVAQKIREAEDPSRAVIGLKNHGLTITGRDLNDIFERIQGKIIPQVPMT